MREKHLKRCWVLGLHGQPPRSRNYNLSEIPALFVAKETGRKAPSASLSELEIQIRQRKGGEERVGVGVGLNSFWVRDWLPSLFLYAVTRKRRKRKNFEFSIRQPLSIYACLLRHSNSVQRVGIAT